jgi:hypothetical protein
MTFGVCLLAAVTAESGLASEGFSWWQSVGGLLAVFGLLMLTLKLLGRANRRQGSAPADVLTVWRLGPKREIQVLRLGDEAHFIYRHDGAMVLLKQEPLAVFQATHQKAAAEGNPLGLKRFFPGGLPFGGLSAKSAGPAPDLTSS